MSERQPMYEGDAQNDDSLPSTDSSLRAPGTKPSSPKTEKKSFVRKVYARWKQIFGGYSLAIMVFGTLVILGASAVLLYLWLRTYFGSRADRDSPGLFRLIVQYSAAPQVVTVCAAAIRTCISLQLALLTAALASVMIEQSGVPLAEAAALSLKRATGAGLFEFMSISEQKRLWRKPRGPMIAALTFVAGLLSLVTAFASTILLSDFSDQAVAGVSKTMLAGVEPLYPYFQMGKGSDWKMATPATWRFGIVDNANLQNYSTAADVTDDDRDTGDLIVAMLPFTDAERRRSLLRYEGPAAVSNLRTFCYAPKDEDVLELSIVKDETTRSGLSINGSLMLWPDSNMLDSLWDSRLMLDENGHHKPVYFHCPLLMDLDVGPQAQQQSSYVGMCPTNITWGLQFRTSPNVVLNITDLSALESIYDEDPGKWGLRSQRASNDSVWTTVTERAGQGDSKQTSPLVDLSICITYAGATTRSVVMRGKALDDEPTAIPARRRQDDPDSPRRLADGRLDVYEDNTISPDYQGEAPYGWDTAKLSDQLHGKRPDGTLLSITDRGLLEMLDFGETWAIRNFKMDVLGSGNLAQGEVDITSIPSRGILIRNVTYPATYLGFDLDQPDFTPHMIFSSEFLDVWANTESLPSAMQTLMLRLWQTHYATYVLSSNNTYNVNATFATTTLLPVRWTGLSIVLGMVVVHLIVGAIATAMFVRYVQGSKLWHPWQAVAQLYTPETTESIEVAKDADEKDLKKWINEQEGGKEFYMVTQAQATGRYELQNARHRKEFEGRETDT